ncbi:ribulose-phosphate 3-epimerase [Candidatus Microgenomates bacterium]|nr:ribulose-phosphate 3-epimerase [Candidatus Microgenomates bacterium]
MVQIIPSILTGSPKELEEKIRLLEEVRVVDPELCRRIQIDIIDGVFADNKTVLPDVLETIETEILIDFHLMTKEPIDWVERCARGFADRIFGHIEEMSDQVEFVSKVQEVGAKVGLALDLETPVGEIDQTLLTNLDCVLIMSVKAGFGGQQFDPRVLPKIKKLDEIRVRDDTPFLISVDGGVNEEDIKQIARAGADEVIVGESLFKGDVEENIRNLLKAAY